MKTTALTLTIGSIRLPISADGRLHAQTALLQLGLDLSTPRSWEWLVAKHGLVSEKRDFGIGPEETLGLDEFVRLAFELDTPQAARWRKRAQETMVRAMQGDVKLAASIAERSSDPEARRWLAARLESTDARRELMSTVARHGGAQQVYGQLGSISNQAVLGCDSATVRRERGVKHTRDGLTSTELLRLAYIDTATTHAIEKRRANGNAEILRLHQRIAQREQNAWETLTPAG